MGIRETLNENPAITTGVTAGIIIIAIAIILWSQCDRTPTVQIPTQYYYTTSENPQTLDDLFTAPRGQLPPFEHEGQTAVRARVFSCDGGRTHIIGWLERLTPEGRAMAQQMLDATGGEAPMPMEAMAMHQMEVKSPGGQWHHINSEQGQEVVMVRCPDGTRENLREVHPR